MTTSISNPSKQANGLAALFAHHARSIIRLDAVVTILAGLEMTLMPALFVNLHGLGDTPLWAVRELGIEWLLFGIWLATLWNKPLTPAKAKFAIAVLAINAFFILVAPAVFGLNYSPLGWALTIGTVFFMDLVSFAWWQVLKGRVNGGAAGA